VISGECVAFGGGVNSINEGVYLACDGSPLQVVVDQQTSVPGGGGATFTFVSSLSVSIDGRRVAFLGNGPPGQQGIYLYENGGLTKVVDRSDTLDGLLATGFTVGRRALEGRTIAFAVFPGGPAQAVYLAEPGLPFVPPVDLAAAVLPTSRSGVVDQPLSVFATIINNTADNVTGCTIRMVSLVPAEFSFVTTDPGTNAPNGVPNIAVGVPAGKSQTFLLQLIGRRAFPVTQIIFEFACDGVEPGREIIGVNSLALSVSEAATLDPIAVPIEDTRTGIVTVPDAVPPSSLAGPESGPAREAIAPGGTGVLAVAVSNVGAASAATVRADSGGASLPLTLTVCETVPATGACLAAPAAEVQTFMGSGATPTFGVFVQGQVVDGVQQAVPFDPARHRVFVRIRDAGGVIRGESSVAVRTAN
jgi:hypothetical protein